VNFLPIRVRLSGQTSFSKFAHAVKDTVLDAYDHQKYTYGTLVQKLKLPRVLGRPPLISAMFNIDKSGFDVFGFEQLDFQVTYNAKRRVNFDLFFNLIQTETSLEVECEYNSDLFDNETIVQWLTSFETLIEAIVTDDCTPVDFLPLISKKERQMILVEWNKTEAAYPREKTLHALLAEQTQRIPNAIALTHENGRLTYRELDRRANQLANRLRTLGVGPNVLVGVCLFRSVEMVVGLLGILKAGGAYVPMDPEYPHDRLAFMLQDAGARVLLTEKRLLTSLPPHAARVICLDSEWLDIAKESDNPPIVPMVATELAYIIYTSGSTGRPKGVQIEHRSVVAFATWARRVFTDEEFAGVMFSTSICFDLSVFELFVTLVNGGKVILAKNVLELPTLPTASEVRLVNTVPSAIAELARTNGIPRSVITVNLAGEPLAQSLVDKLYTDYFVQRVYDLYGPTETTTYSTYTLRQRGGKTTIGRPIANTRIHILDLHHQPTPIGVPGELHIGGIGLARGYHNQPELTAESFISDPFEMETGSRLYKTGDMARYLADGNIEYVGRLDHQVKIRGIRIELSEIESVLATHPSVRKAVVVARADVHGDKQLVTYMTGKNGVPPKSSELRNLLKSKLPEYMMPAAFVTLEQFPLTPNGKVDRKALPMPEFESAAGQFVPPSTPTEETLAKIWCEVLGLKQVGIRDNFFDLGGHSLLSIRLLHKINLVLKLDLPVRSLFQNPTIEDLVKSLPAQRKKERKPELMQLHAGNSGPELFFLIDEGSLGLFKLAHSMSEDFPSYASLVPLPEPALKASANKQFSALPRMEDLAAEHAALIKSHQTNGSLLLVGHCFGGLLAFEVAHQLQRAGKQVEAVLMLDTWMIEPTFWWQKKAWFRAHVWKLLQQGSPYLWRKSLRRINLEKDKLASRLNLAIHGDFNAHVPWAIIERIYNHVIYGYRPQVLANRGMLFVSQDDWLSKAYRQLDDSLGASRWFGGGVEVMDVPGDHVTVLDEPRLPELAKCFRSSLEKLRLKQINSPGVIPFT
jgi:amino acid adenylation domain-containing protein